MCVATERGTSDNTEATRFSQCAHDQRRRLEAEDCDSIRCAHLISGGRRRIRPPRSRSPHNVLRVDAGYIGRLEMMRPERRAGSRNRESPSRNEGGTDMAVLSLDDLRTVLKETFAARSKWHYIGLELAVKASELDAIKKDNPEVKDCYRETLTCWLKGVAPKPVGS